MRNWNHKRDIAFVLSLLMAVTATHAQEDPYEVVYRGLPSEIERMLSDGLDPNTKVFVRNWWGTEQYLLLVAAAFNRNPAMVSALVKAGADLYASDHSGRSALDCATYWNSNIAVARKLIELGADVNSVNHFGDSVLVVAAEEKDYTWVKLLIEAGADIHAEPPSWLGVTPFLAAVKNQSDPRTIDLFIDAGVDVNKIYAGGTTALIECVISNNEEEIVRRLLDSGANVNAKTNNGVSALWAACYLTANPGIVDVLLDYGADVNVVARDGTSVLDRAKNNYAVRDTTTYDRLIELQDRD